MDDTRSFYDDTANTLEHRLRCRITNVHVCGVTPLITSSHIYLWARMGDDCESVAGHLTFECARKRKSFFFI